MDDWTPTPVSGGGKRAIDYIAHGIFFFIYGFAKYIPSPVGDLLRFVIVRPWMKTNGYTKISERVSIWYPYNIRIGKNVTLNESVFISGFGGLKIGDGVRIGHRTTILTSNHKYDSTEIPIYKQGIEGKPVIIEDDVFIGTNVVILPGVKISKGAVISAGSVVSHNVKPYRIVGGVPAVTMGNREKK